MIANFKKTFPHSAPYRVSVINKSKGMPAKHAAKNIRISTPATVCIETTNGHKVMMRFAQSKPDNGTEAIYRNTDSPALTMEVHCESGSPVRISCSADPTKAHTVDEAVQAISVFRDVFLGSVTINGEKVPMEMDISDIEIDNIEEKTAFWEAAANLEKKLGVQFSPSASLSKLDADIFRYLDTCFNKKEYVTIRHPFDFLHFDYKFLRDSKPVDLDQLVGENGLVLNFVEGPERRILMGAEIELYSKSSIEDAVIKKIDWDDATRKSSGTLYITDAPGKTWTLKRMFTTKEEVQKLEEGSAANCTD